MGSETRHIFREPLTSESDLICGNVVPPLRKDAVTICLSSSNEYAPFLCVTISSILQNVKEDKYYDIVVLTTDISENNKRIILRYASRYANICIRFMDVSSLIEGKAFYTRAHFTAFTYYRLLIPDLFSDYEKVIYLDSDVVVTTDVSELFETDVSNYLLAAAFDTHVMGRLNPSNPACELEYYQNVLRANDYGYFQAGVMLFNIKQFCNCYKQGELIENASKSHYRWLDQDFLNVECRGRVKFLDNSWNVMVINNPKNVDEEYLSDEAYQAYLTAKHDPKIIHYVGKSIPCFVPSVDMYQYYWPYARDTPYYELILSKMVNEAEKRMRRQQTLKQRIKAEWIMPVLNKILPKGSKRRLFFKRAYFKLRGWEI